MLEDVLGYYKNRLNTSDKAVFEKKLKEIETAKEYFTPEKTAERLKNQEKIMQNLERDVSAKIIQAKDTIAGKIKQKPFKDNMKLKDTCTFWAEDSLMFERNRIEEEGVNVINSLVGDGKTKQGAYRELVEILSPHLTQEEKLALEESINHTEKIMRKANVTECVEYFDKKRDLVLGSAPTDVLTALAGLTASGIAIGVADTTEDRISRMISGALPVFAGLGVSTALTAMLFSGGKGMALGTGSGMILSALGSAASHKMFPKNKTELLMAENEKNVTKEGEVKNA